MKHLFLGIFLLMASVAFAQTENLPIDTINGKAVYRYKVQKSEGLFRISQNFGVSQDEIIRYNPILQSEGIKLGQTLIIPVIQKIDSTGYTVHCLEAKETLYSLSRTYGVTVDQIKALNPETSKTMQIGQCLLIKKNESATKEETKAEPVVKEEPKAEPVVEAIQETPEVATKDEDKWHEAKPINDWGAAKPIMKDIVPDDSLVKPFPGKHPAKLDSLPLKEALDTLTQQIDDIIDSIVPDSQMLSLTPLRIAYMMPFFTDATKRDASMDRFIDFYEGALIAIYEAQQRGQKFDIYTYDTRKEDIAIQRILQKPELQNIDAIIGPAYPAQVTYASAFAKQNRIPLFVPFTAKVAGTDTNPYIWQFNPTVNIEAKAIIDHLMPQKDQVQLIFVEPKAANSPQSEQALYQAAADSGFLIATTSIANITRDSIESLLDADKRNIFIFNSEKYSAVQVLIPNIFKLSGKYDIAMVGQYSWSTSETALPMIYATVFHDVDSIRGANYQALYERYFGHELSSSHPRYDLLGYDITSYIIHTLVMAQQALSEEQKNNILNTLFEGLSTNIALERIAPAGGCINHGIKVIETK